MFSEGAKKGKKKSKKTVSLNDFLSGSPGKGPPSKGPGNWADATDDIDPSGEFYIGVVNVGELAVWSAEITTNWPSEKQERRPNFDRSKLPNAPRASTAAEIDMRRLPSRPPYTVYLGNLSYECSEEDIEELFMRKKLKVSKGEVWWHGDKVGTCRPSQCGSLWRVGLSG